MAVPQFYYAQAFVMGSLYSIFANLMIVTACQMTLYYWQKPLASLDELWRNGWHYGAIVFLICLLLAFDDEMESFKDRLDMFYTRKEQERNPRPAFYQSVEARATGVTLRRGNDALTPLSSAHYAIIYKRLARKRHTRQWKITRNDLDVKHGGVGAFENLTAIYPKILQHWQWLKWVDEKDGAYYLNEQGQAAFVRNGRLSVNGSASPIE